MAPAHDQHHPADPLPVSAELADMLAGIMAPGGKFGHREHVHLAFAAIQRYGPAAAPDVVAGWLRQLTAYERAPQKFHATVTRAWTAMIAFHAAACAPGTSFEEFARRTPALLDKRLLMRHYSSRLLASAAARASWAEPDLAGFPWQEPVAMPGGSSEPGPESGGMSRSM